MKSDRFGCSTCPPGKEQFERFNLISRSAVQYEYRHIDGSLFTAVAGSLKQARKMKDQWLTNKASNGR